MHVIQPSVPFLVWATYLLKAEALSLCRPCSLGASSGIRGSHSAAPLRPSSGGEDACLHVTHQLLGCCLWNRVSLGLFPAPRVFWKTCPLKYQHFKQKDHLLGLLGLLQKSLPCLNSEELYVCYQCSPLFGWNFPEFSSCSSQFVIWSGHILLVALKSSFSLSLPDEF